MKRKLVAVWTSLMSQIRTGHRQVPMSVRRSINVGQKATATMIEVNGELLLLGVTNSTVTLIQRWQNANGIPIRGVVR